MAKGSFKLPKDKCVMQAAPKRSFAKNFGFRYIKRGSTYLLIGCPKGKTESVPYKKKKVKGKTVSMRRVVCTVGTKAFEIIKARKKGQKCPKGYERRS